MSSLPLVRLYGCTGMHTNTSCNQFLSLHSSNFPLVIAYRALGGGGNIRKGDPYLSPQSMIWKGARRMSKGSVIFWEVEMLKPYPVTPAQCWPSGCRAGMLPALRRSQSQSQMYVHGTCLSAAVVGTLSMQYLILEGSCRISESSFKVRVS